MIREECYNVMQLKICWKLISHGRSAFGVFVHVQFVGSVSAIFQRE